jgi:hypothetical protein
MFRIYYHLYLGASWRDVWALHRPVLEQFAASELLGKIVVCVCGGTVDDLGIATADNLEIRCLSNRIDNINEFHTLEQMHLDARDPAQAFDYCAYLHSKGSSSQRLDRAAAEWSSFLSTALIRSLPGFGRVVAMGFNCLGSNLALGVFEDFGRPRLHYSGNFWCATRELVTSAPEIRLGGRDASVRHNAEWWLDRASSFTPFNVFSTGIDHYTAPPGAIDWIRLESRLGEFSSSPGSASHAMETINFLRGMIQRATGNQFLRHSLSDALIRVLPHHRWRRLLNLHDVMMRVIGSRKSIYFYCPESP